MNLIVNGKQYEVETYVEALKCGCANARGEDYVVFGKMEVFVKELVCQMDFEDDNNLEFAQQMLEECKENNAYFCENVQSKEYVYFKVEDEVLNDEELLSEYIVKNILKLDII